MEIWENLSLEDIQDEIWKDIKDYEGLYQISSKGRVKSLERKTATKIVKEKILKLHKAKYLQAKLCKKSKIWMPVVGKLVGEAFIQKPNYKCVINHKDSIPWNNCVENLEWVSQSENIRYSHYLGNSNQKGEKNNRAKITFDKVKEIRAYFKTNPHLSQKEIGVFFGLKREHVKDIINYKSWNY